jgi:SAM-dependent methyltransferase
MFTPLLLAVALAAAADSAAPPDPIAKLRADAEALRPLVTTRLARDFLSATARMPRVAPRTVWRDSARTNAWSDAQAKALPDSERARLIPRALDESFYWNTRYGTPLAYARALELLARYGFGDVRGRRVLDFGCGTLGHLRLLASLGADAVGLDVDPLLPALYSQPGDQGEIHVENRGENRGDQATGRLRLVTGQWPASDAIVREVGGGYDLFLSKNTLKNGYLHPAEKVDPRMLVHLGVSDSAYLAQLARTVRPGGRVMIYNLCPAPAPPGKPYIPWADGYCPFPRKAWERAGFRVVVFDRDDTPAARRMGRALGWDQGGMNLEKDLFATWSLFERKR